MTLLTASWSEIDVRNLPYQSWKYEWAVMNLPQLWVVSKTRKTIWFMFQNQLHGYNFSFTYCFANCEWYFLPSIYKVHGWDQKEISSTKTDSAYIFKDFTVSVIGASWLRNLHWCLALLCCAWEYQIVVEESKENTSKPWASKTSLP